MDLPQRIAKIEEQVLPLGGRVVSVVNVDSWPISIDNDHTPLFDIPSGWYVVSQKGSVIANVHRALMDWTCELTPVEQDWVFKAMALMCSKKINANWRVVMSLPVGSLERLEGVPGPKPGWFPDIDAERIKSSTMDLVRRCAQAEIDVSDVPVYLVRPWVAGDGQEPWEVHVPAPGGGFPGFRIPQCIVTALQAEIIGQSDACRDNYSSQRG